MLSGDTRIALAVDAIPGQPALDRKKTGTFRECNGSAEQMYDGRALGHLAFAGS